MIRQRPVARFAVHVRVLALRLLIRHIRVAALAGLVPGKLHRLGRNFTNRRAPIVPILPKRLRNYIVAHHQKHHKREYK